VVACHGAEKHPDHSPQRYRAPALSAVSDAYDAGADQSVRKYRDADLRVPEMRRGHYKVVRIGPYEVRCCWLAERRVKAAGVGAELANALN
jgi:hypothetical protein